MIERLKKDFHNKCYICEMKELQDPNVEHLLPHKNGKYPERKFDWENLFWSCSHCNGVKNSGKYDDGILDCCKDDPEKVLSFSLVNDDVMITILNLGHEIQERTALLITEVFSLKNTGMRTYRSPGPSRSLPGIFPLPVCPFLLWNCALELFFQLSMLACQDGRLRKLPFLAAV